VQVAGSSTVLPYAAIVAEAFGENFDFPTPVVESGGSLAGLMKFCEGVGETTIDIANASRGIKDSEVAACADNGVTEIIEVRIGYDGIVFASDINGNSFEFTPTDWYLALSEQIVVDGALVDNPCTKWNEVNPDLPAQEIQAFIPGTKHGTREVFEDKVILAGCEATGDFETYLGAAVGDTDKALKKPRKSLYWSAHRWPHPRACLGRRGSSCATFAARILWDQRRPLRVGSGIFSVDQLAFDPTRTD